MAIEIAVGGGIENIAAAEVLIHGRAAAQHGERFSLPPGIAQQIRHLARGKLTFRTDAAGRLCAGVGADIVPVIGVAVRHGTEAVAFGVGAVIAHDAARAACRYGQVIHVAARNGTAVVCADQAARNAVLGVHLGVDIDVHRVAVLHRATQDLTDDGAHAGVLACAGIGEVLHAQVLHGTADRAEQTEGCVCGGRARDAQIGDHVAVAVKGARIARVGIGGRIIIERGGGDGRPRDVGHVDVSGEDGVGGLVAAAHQCRKRHKLTCVGDFISLASG